MGERTVREWAVYYRQSNCLAPPQPLRENEEAVRMWAKEAHERGFDVVVVQRDVTYGDWQVSTDA